MNYKEAGVDTEKAQGYLKDLKKSITDTYQKSVHGKVLDNFGGFAGIFKTNEALNGWSLVASTDGVGTKIELAKQFQYFDGLGTDLVAMCINDLYCVGATPLFFLDYVACGKLNDSWYFPVIQGIAKACSRTSVALLGGETAEHPGVMKDDDFDLAGFIVGAVDPARVLPMPDKIQAGDLLYGFSSSGLHSNGFSLVRKVLKKLSEDDQTQYNTLIQDKSWVKEQLLAPTQIYDFIPELLKNAKVKGIAHITGGGIYENLPRVLPENLYADVKSPEVFKREIYTLLSRYVPLKDMYHAFNMGLGMIAVASAGEKNSMEKYGARVIGEIKQKENDSQSVIIQGIDT